MVEVGRKCIFRQFRRPSHLKIPDGSKIACATLSRRAIDGPCAVDLGRFCVVHIFCCITVNVHYMVII